MKQSAGSGGGGGPFPFPARALDMSAVKGAALSEGMAQLVASANAVAGPIGV